MTDIRTLIFDTETNGKRAKEKNPPLGSEPAITQIAAILFWGRRPVAHLSCFVRPLNFDGTPAVIPIEQFFIDAGITQDTVDAVGRPLKTGLAEFNQMVKSADRVVAHNIQFDDPITRSNYCRVTAPQRDYWDTPKFCTMKTLEPVLKLPGKYGFKYPTLDESYRALVDPMGFSGAHDAMVDVQACASVLWAIEDKIAEGDPRFNGHKLWQLPESWPKE
jgi:DNA polymerase III epsilon subunit-like protein